MDRIPSDHGSIRTVRAELARHGGRRLRLEVPGEAADQFPEGEVVRVSLDGTRRHARIDAHLTDDRPIVTGVYDGPDAARDPGDARDRLAEWIEAEGLEAGDPVLVDVVAEEFLYGLRVPGERVFYDDPDPPDSDLASIARNLEDRF